MSPLILREFSFAVQPLRSLCCISGHAPATAGVELLVVERGFDLASHAFRKAAPVSALWDNGVHSWQDFSTVLLLFFVFV